MVNLREQEDCDRIEAACGGPENAFRLLRVLQDAQADWRPDNWFHPDRRPSLYRLFYNRATREGFSPESVRLMARFNGVSE